MKISDFQTATSKDREQYVVRPYEQVPMTTLVPGSQSHLVFGERICFSFLTMKAGSVFEIHSHPEEQMMFVLEGYCDEIIDGKIYRVTAGDAIHLPSGVPHGAFLGEVDCKVIDVFAPARTDYAQKHYDQHPGVRLPFRGEK